LSRERERDHDRAKADDARIEQSLFERFALFVHFLDEVEEHNDVADNDADEAGDTEEGHEAERRSHQVKGNERADDSVRGGREDEERFGE